MKTVFKPLGLAAAVAAVTAGYTGAVSAQQVSARNHGDLALIPYYTVDSGFQTAVHIINHSSSTQVVKLRARRGLDSMDSLDFNLIMSPDDVWVGSLSQKNDENNSIVWTTNDTTCTAPAGKQTGVEGQVEFVMPDQLSVSTLVDFREGAEEGYIEVIGMAQIEDESYPVAIDANHTSEGVPLDCQGVRENFFRIDGAVTSTAIAGTEKGVFNNASTYQSCDLPGVGNCSAFGFEENVWEDTQDDALIVSWAVTDGNSGLEFGSNAVHIEGFESVPMMSNQQVILLGLDDGLGYLFPDLDGGPVNFTPRGRYDAVDGVRALLGAPSLQNDWSSRQQEAFTVGTDWVVTMPGQYLMVDPVQYVLSLEEPDDLVECLPIVCDWRDIPVTLNITFYNREELGFTPEEGGLVVSPAINTSPDGINLPYEVNVINWKSALGTVEDIIESQYGVDFEPQFQHDRGWADLAVDPSTLKSPQQVWDRTEITAGDPNSALGATPVVNTNVPIIGFAAWERNFAASPDANYGRAIDHAYGS